MINKLKKKFVVLSLSSILVFLLTIIIGMNIINYSSIINEADTVLEILSQNKGNFPEINDKKEEKFKDNMSPELPYESRYFSVLINNNEIIGVETSRVIAVDEKIAIEYANQLISKNKEKGFIDNYRYTFFEEEVNTRIIFLDCGRKLETFKTFLFASIGITLGGYLIIVFIICFFSEKFIHPIIESYEKQKRFITDAGHEIKTPLTIIKANVDILEMENEDNESLNDIKQQIRKLSNLTNDLVYLARMEENNQKLEMISLPFSDLLEEAINSFSILFEKRKIDIIVDIQPNISINGNLKSIQQLISILLDNALKYCSFEGKVKIDLLKKGHNVILMVANTTSTKVEKENLEYVFDRFYRGDSSRNSNLGGQGIGLSIAKAIVDAHEGKIQAYSDNEYSFGILINFKEKITL